MTLFDADGREIQQPDIHDPQGLSPADTELLGAMAAEIRALDAEGDLMMIQVSPLSAVQLAGLLQLALRHDGVEGSIREAALLFLYDVREYFATCPAVLEVMRRGEDPAHDVLP